MAPLSKGERAEVCWQGRQEIRAMISEPGVEGVGFDVAEALEILFSPVLGERVISISCHQSISSTFLIPQSWNHFLRPMPTRKWASGCFLWISRTVG